MANGAHAPLHALLEATEPINDQQIELGEAMASAMAWGSYGVVHYGDGGLPQDIKTEGGRRIAKLFYLRQGFNGDFDSIAAREGKRAVRQQLGSDGIDLSEDALNILAEEVLAAIHRVEAWIAHEN